MNILCKLNLIFPDYTNIDSPVTLLLTISDLSIVLIFPTIL